MPKKATLKKAKLETTNAISTFPCRFNCGQVSANERGRVLHEQRKHSLVYSENSGMIGQGAGPDITGQQPILTSQFAQFVNMALTQPIETAENLTRILTEATKVRTIADEQIGLVNRILTAMQAAPPMAQSAGVR